MWCIGALTEQYRQRMYELLALYARPHCDGEPVVCLDEKSTQLLADSRTALPMRPGRPLRRTTSTGAKAPAICLWQSNRRLAGAACS